MYISFLIPVLQSWYKTIFTIILIRIYFRISLKRGQIQILRGGQSHIKYRESQLPRGGGESTPS